MFYRERTHPCVLDAIAFKSVRCKFNLILGKHLYAVKHDVARKDACAPGNGESYFIEVFIFNEHKA